MSGGSFRIVIIFACVTTLCLTQSTTTSDASSDWSSESESQSPTTAHVSTPGISTTTATGDATDAYSETTAQQTTKGNDQTSSLDSSAAENSGVSTISESYTSDENVCFCPNITTTLTCTCEAGNGIIVNENETVSDNPVEVSYYIDCQDNETVLVHFSTSDVQKLYSLCTITIGDKTFDDPASINSIGYGYVDAYTPITVSGYLDKKYCKYKIYYTTYAPDIIITTLNETEGTLLAPEDEFGLFYYRPNTKVLWILQPSELVSSINFTFEYLNLGTPYVELHGESEANTTQGDFLLIGAGQDLLQGNDFMFYGVRDPADSRTIITIGSQSHVYFSSSTTIFNATGFNITYAATVYKPTTTPSPVTTPVPPAPDNLDTTYLVSIEGASPNITIINKTMQNFKLAIADMSQRYAEMKGFQMKEPITIESVEVYEATTCNIFHCNPECVAFNFSVASVSPNGTWLFTTPVLEDMVNDPSLKDSFNVMGNDCQVCSDDKKLNLWVYIPLCIGIVLLGGVVSFVLWRAGEKEQFEAMKIEYDKKIEAFRWDNRRRSSGNISILGLGGSIASRASQDSRRFTMPFPKAKRDSDDVLDGEGEDVVDTTGFTEYDPYLGRVDPADLGLSKDFVNDKLTMSHYGNPGFVDDEGDTDDQTEFDRGVVTATVSAGTDSEDSDGGALCFTDSTIGKKSKTVTLQAMADVHMTDEGQQLDDITCEETSF